MKKIPPNQFRMRGLHPLASTDEDGMNGYFQIPLTGFGHKVIANCIVSDLMGWEHVSAHIVEYGAQCTPTWEHMCCIKDMFWDEEEVVVQYHPAKSDYVNNHPHVLHLWKPTEKTMPVPPSIMVGFKELGTLPNYKKGQT